MGVFFALPQTGEETVFKVKRVTKMSKVFDAYASRKGVARPSIRFLFDGERIDDNDTPESVSMAAFVFTFQFSPGCECSAPWCLVQFLWCCHGFCFCPCHSLSLT